MSKYHCGIMGRVVHAMLVLVLNCLVLHFIHTNFIARKIQSLISAVVSESLHRARQMSACENIINGLILLTAFSLRCKDSSLHTQRSVQVFGVCSAGFSHHAASEQHKSEVNK